MIALEFERESVKPSD